MRNFSMHKLMRDENIEGSFIVKYYDIQIDYVIENGEISFTIPYQTEMMQSSFKKWLLHEQELYRTFIFNFLNEIKKIDIISSTEGVIKEENFDNSFGDKEYILTVSYQQLFSPIQFLFYPENPQTKILYQVPISINSEGNYAKEVYIEEILKEKTIQCMWEPFRSKTKYRLELLHMVR